MVCEKRKEEQRKIREVLDDFSNTLRKIRNGDLAYGHTYHREGDCWSLERVVYERDADGNMVQKS